MSNSPGISSSRGRGRGANTAVTVIERDTALGRFGETEDIAAVAAFLVSG